MRSEALRSDSAAEFGAALITADAPTPVGIVGPDGKPAPKRFNVYRNNVIISLTEALAQTFPAIERLVGKDYFKALAKVFVTEHPPCSPVLIWYGDAFAEFIEAFPPLAGYPYLADVARLEWAWLQAYHAADAEPLNQQVLGAVPPERVGEIRFSLHPAARMISSRWPALSLALANRFAVDDPPHVNLEEPEAVLVTRPDLDVQLQLLRPGAVPFFQELGGTTLQEAAVGAFAAHSDFDLSASLSDLLAAGAFSALLFNGKAEDEHVEQLVWRGVI